MRRFPLWLKRQIKIDENVALLKQTLKAERLNTVCNSARCPNIFECFQRRHATFMILGNICTRSCSFCSVASGLAGTIDEDEPARIAGAVRMLDMKYVVITSVTRDDLPDGGSAAFAKTVKKIRAVSPSVKVEVLVPDFRGSCSSIEEVAESEPDIFGHNVETVPRLYGAIRPKASYGLSLSVLETAKKKCAHIITKSGIMLGLGEREEEVADVLSDLRGAGASCVVIGQYLKPGPGCADVVEFIHPDKFKRYEALAKDMGFSYVLSEPFARSSYKADKEVA